MHWKKKMDFPFPREKKEEETNTNNMSGSSSAYDEVDLEDMEWNEELKAYTYSCPCGDIFRITLDELHDGEEIARCPSCSLILTVVYDPDELPAREWWVKVWVEERRKFGGYFLSSAALRRERRLFFVCAARVMREKTRDEFTTTRRRVFVQ